jgi:Xaa-Pro aminopeptidase
VTPVSGKFTQQQREFYAGVEAAHDWVIANSKPGVKWLDIHLGSARVMVDHLKTLGLMKGDTEEAVMAGAHAMFSPCGLGHMMGMDVHDMEGLGQNYLGFDDEVQPSTQFGLCNLRCGRRLQEGFVMTDEPGMYFIPHLIDLWQSEKKFTQFINYDALGPWRNFGGIRLENDILITKDGCEMIGDKIIPYHIDDVEAFISK